MVPLPSAQLVLALLLLLFFVKHLFPDQAAKKDLGVGAGLKGGEEKRHGLIHPMKS